MGLDFDRIGRRGSFAPEDIQLGYAESLKYTLGRDRFSATPYDRYFAFAMAIRDRIIDRWIETQQTHHDDQVKRVYYLSLEFLMGRALGNNIANLKLDAAAQQAMGQLKVDLGGLEHEEVDAGLGNGGLGRLAACFIDSLATLQIPAVGYGLRYQYGIFRQTIDGGRQVEHPDEWLKYGCPWEIVRPAIKVKVNFGGQVEQWNDNGQLRCVWNGEQHILGVPYDNPIVGYGGDTVNTLRLWSAHSTEDFDFQDFNSGDYIGAVQSRAEAESLTKVLYPNDLHYMGKELRLKQQYFFVACSLGDIVRRFKRDRQAWTEFPNRAALQLNDTHPSLAIPELMRILIDQENLDWEAAFDVTTRAMGYTNHTLMPEALEKWPVPMMQKILPRHLQIVYEINQRFMRKVAIRFPGDMARMARMSLVEESEPKQIRMANLCIVGSHSTNGVARIHTDLLKSRVVPDFAEMYPERFNSKTNGITQRRWLLLSNPELAALITEAIGDRWITNLDELRQLKPLAEDTAFRARFREVKRAGKRRLIDFLAREAQAENWEMRPDFSTDMIFDVQVKRLHEYKRQLLNILHVVMLYNRLRRDPHMQWTPQLFLFGAKAAPGYEMAKLIIKLINNVAATVNNAPEIAGRVKVAFLPNYRVSMAERIFPAADVSEQISTAGTEASGTGNMKFMLNGALTIGTLDGANIEIMEEVGAENMFIFGLNADEAKNLAAHYNPAEYYQSNPEIREALDLVFNGHFSVGEADLFEPIRKSLLEWGDRYMVLADLASYADAQRRMQERYRDRETWSKQAILNIASAGKFSSDRTIKEYANEIWNVRPHPVSKDNRKSKTLIEARIDMV